MQLRAQVDRVCPRTRRTSAELLFERAFKEPGIELRLTIQELPDSIQGARQLDGTE